MAGAALATCGATRPYEALGPARPDTFERAIRKMGDMGYTLVELDDRKRSFQAEFRHGGSSSTGELLVVEWSAARRSR